MSEKGKAMDLTEQTARKWLLDRGVKTTEIAELVYFLQKDYHTKSKIEDCLHNVERVISKKQKFKTPF